MYGGVYPTYHWEDILRDYPQVDYIVRGEGERTATLLLQALRDGAEPASVDGIAWRTDGVPAASAPAEMIRDLDDYRIGWELIDHSRHSYFTYATACAGTRAWGGVSGSRRLPSSSWASG